MINKKTSSLVRLMIPACLAVAFLSAGHAEIYKWVDRDGRTHYSDSNDNAAPAKGAGSKPAPQAAPSSGGAAEYWQEQDRQFRERQIAKKSMDAIPKSASPRPKSLSSGKVDDGSDTSRCNLAKDVLSGAVRHVNGAATDGYDRQVAENDVRTFCH